MKPPTTQLYAHLYLDTTNAHPRPTLAIESCQSYRRTRALAHRIAAQAEDLSAVTAADWIIQISGAYQGVQRGSTRVHVSIELAASGGPESGLVLLEEGARLCGVEATK